MCLCLFALDQHDEFPFILLANRDEFRKRPSAKAAFWEDKPAILAGRDLQGMGTWLGTTKTGKVAFLTNYRDPKNINSNAPTRGALVSDFLSSEMDAELYLKAISDPEKFNGFNLVVGEWNNLFYFSNIKNKPQQIKAGIHGLTNAFLNSNWPKSETGKQQLKEAIKSNNLDNSDLFNILRNSEKPIDSLLPETGVGLELERVLSSRFINTPEYGTVCSTIIKIDRNNMCFFEEKTFDKNGDEVGKEKYKFQIMP